MCSRLAFAVESDGSTTYRCSQVISATGATGPRTGSNQNRLRSVCGVLVHSSARVRRHRARGTRRHGAPRRRALAAHRPSPGRGGDARRGGQLPSWDGELLRIDRYHRSIGQHSSSRKIACAPSALASHGAHGDRTSVHRCWAGRPRVCQKRPTSTDVASLLQQRQALPEASSVFSVFLGGLTL